MSERKCLVCRHGRREEIDRALTRGAENRTVARQFGVSSRALEHHRTAHLLKQGTRRYPFGPPSGGRDERRIIPAEGGGWQPAKRRLRSWDDLFRGFK